MSGVGEQAHDEEAGRAGDGERAVEIALVLGGGPVEVDLDDVTGDGHGNADLQVAVDGLDHVRRLVAPVGEGRNTGAHAALRVGVQFGHGGLDARPAAPSTSSAIRWSASRCAASCAPEVAATLVGVARVGGDQGRAAHRRGESAG